MRKAILTVTGCAVLLWVSAAQAGSTCNGERYKAAGKYAACQGKALAKLDAGGDYDAFRLSASKCRVKYTAIWERLQSKFNGTPTLCEGSRFVDNANGTVTDNLTGLTWEQKTDDDTVHDKDNLYSWSSGLGRADGSVFTDFLMSLRNSDGCFTGQCDWRLPTRDELQTILLEPYPCATSPCINQALFGPTQSNLYWSATTSATNPLEAWFVLFNEGSAGSYTKTIAVYARAVRGGL